MFKVWSIIILGVTMLSAGMAVVSLDHRGATADELKCTGMWQAIDGSGERADLSYSEGSFQLRITGPAHNLVLFCSSGRMQNGSVVFRSNAQDSSSGDDPWAFITVKPDADRITIEGYSAAPRVFLPMQH